jgi:hypothetical protein
MKALRNPRLTFVLGVVIALVTVWCNAVPTRVDAEGMSEATGGGCFDYCVNDDSADCSGCEDEYNDCYWEEGDNNKVCKKYTEFKGCRSTGCTQTTQKSCQSF